MAACQVFTPQISVAVPDIWRTFSLIPRAGGSAAPYLAWRI